MFNRKKPWDDMDVTGWHYEIVPDGEKHWKAYVTDPEGQKYGNIFSDYWVIKAKNLEVAEAKVLDDIKQAAYNHTVIVSKTL